LYWKKKSRLFQAAAVAAFKSYFSFDFLPRFFNNNNKKQPISGVIGLKSTK